jgi:hypothetical protein
VLPDTNSIDALSSKMHTSSVSDGIYTDVSYEPFDGALANPISVRDLLPDLLAVIF